MKTQTRTGTKRGARAPRANEGGFLLVMVMVVMLVLSTIAASTLINSFLERSLAKNQNYASIALQASDGGLAAGMSWIRENGSTLPVKDPITGLWPNWEQRIPNTPSSTPPYTRTLSSGGSYSVTLRYKREWRDLNGDGDCHDAGEISGYYDDAADRGADGVIGTADDPHLPCPGDIVLYNSCATGADTCFGFPDALYKNAGEGFPIIEILSVGTRGNTSYREIAMDVARNKIDIQVEGAITARGPVTQGGSGYADGHGWNLAGTAQDNACNDQPAVTVDAGLTAPPAAAGGCGVPGGNAKGLYGGDPGPDLICGTADDDPPATAVFDPTAPGKRPLETTPWGMMGIDKAAFDSLFTATTTATTVTGTQANPTYVWQKGDLHITGGSGFGILVVHNENFNPDVYERSDPSSTLYNTSHSDYLPEADSSNAAYDASYAPATFFMNGNVNYTGVIIADQMVRVNGTASTVGALLSLGGINVSGDVTGNWSAKYSCDAIEKALGGFGYGTKIAWHRLR